MATRLVLGRGPINCPLFFFERAVLAVRCSKCSFTASGPLPPTGFDRVFASQHATDGANAKRGWHLESQRQSSCKASVNLHG